MCMYNARTHDRIMGIVCTEKRTLFLVVIQNMDRVEIRPDVIYYILILYITLVMCMKRRRTRRRKELRKRTEKKVNQKRYS